MNQKELQLQFHFKVLNALSEIFNEDSENCVNELLQENSNAATELIHVIGSTVPVHIYNHITGDNLNTLEFNHVSNKLIFQNSKLVNDEEE